MAARVESGSGALSPVDGCSEHQPESYLRQYQRLASWVDASLECFRCELAQLLYPLFVYSYLRTVQEKQGIHARDQLTALKARFLQSESASVSVVKELEDLSAIVHHQHLQSNAAKEFLNGVTTIKLSKTSYALFMDFIQRREMWSIMGVCNEFLRFDTQNSALSLKHIRPVESLRVKDTTDEGVVTNSKDVEIGLLKGCLEDVLVTRALDASMQDPGAALAAPTADDEARSEEGRAADGEKVEGGEEQADAAEGEQKAAAAPSDDGAAKMDVDAEAGPSTQASAPKTKASKRKAEGVKRQERETQKRNEAILQKWTEGLVEPRIPLKPLAPVVQEAALEQLQNCAPLSATDAPSCCMFKINQAEHSINSMATSDDVQWLAAGTSASCVQLYDLQKLPRAHCAESTAQPWEGSFDEGDCVKHLWGHNGPVYGLSFSCDKRLLYSCGCDGTVRMWITEMGANAVIWRSHMLPVWDVAACPRGHWLVSGGADWVVSLWCDEHIHPLRQLVGHQGEVGCVSWHPNCNLIISGSGGDRTVRMWDVREGKACRIMPKASSGVTKVVCSPDGTTVASGTSDGSVQLWDLRSAQCLCTLAAHKGVVSSMSFSRAGQLLATGGTDCSMCLWQPCWSSQHSSAASPLFEELPGVASRGPVPYEEYSWHLTPNAPVTLLEFTRSNLLLVGGPSLPSGRVLS